MINKIILTNFQSHSESELILNPGINAIIGSSDSGKTAILRALHWAIYNRPSGEAFISHWARDSKEKQTDTCQVYIEKGKDCIIRYRTPGSLNGYKINDQTLEAIKTDVPTDVREFFNISEVNLQKQMDAPFLLSESPGEIARFFNRIIKLDEIDACLSAADKKKRDCAHDMKATEAEREKLGKELEKYGYIEDVMPLLDRARKIQLKIERIHTESEQVGTLYQKWAKHRYTVNIYAETVYIEGKLQDAEAISTEIHTAEAKLKVLSDSLQTWQQYDEEREAFRALLDVEQPIERAAKLYAKIEDLSGVLNLYTISVNNYRYYCEQIEKADARIPHYEKELPDVCPTCGAPMKKE